MIISASQISLSISYSSSHFFQEEQEQSLRKSSVDVEWSGVVHKRQIYSSLV
jgi:hypothetical protein